MANIVMSSVICGIHRTKVGSNREVRLHVENNDSIPRIDPNCMVVKIPQMEDIPVKLHGRVSYPKSCNANANWTNAKQISMSEMLLATKLEMSLLTYVVFSDG